IGIEHAGDGVAQRTGVPEVAQSDRAGAEHDESHRSLLPSLAVTGQLEHDHPAAGRPLRVHLAEAAAPEHAQLCRVVREDPGAFTPLRSTRTFSAENASPVLIARTANTERSANRRSSPSTGRTFLSPVPSTASA